MDGNVQKAVYSVFMFKITHNESVQHEEVKTLLDEGAMLRGFKLNLSSIRNNSCPESHQRPLQAAPFSHRKREWSKTDLEGAFPYYGLPALTAW